MNHAPKSKNKITKAIVLGAMAITALCVVYTTPQKNASSAKSGHFHARLIYVGHAPKTANG